MRIEKDSLGTMEVPDEAYYGIQSVRCASNYPVTDHTFDELPEILRAMSEIKKACAKTNMEIGALDKSKACAIMQACDEIIAGKFKGQFPVNVWRSHGTGVNMNINEVVANRANEILTGHKGYDAVHPNTHVNMGQSSNDVYPTSTNIVVYRMTGEALKSIRYLEEALGHRAEEFKDCVRLGRTCLQDAVPNTFGQVFGAWHHMVYRNRKMLEDYRETFRGVILGSTVLGTGMGTMPGYFEKIMKNLSEIVGFEVYWPAWKDEKVEDSAVFDEMMNADSLMTLCDLLKTVAMSAARISTDLFILSSGPSGGFGEIKLPAISPGSSIMPGKINPYMPELMHQIMQQACVSAQTATMTQAENDGDETISPGASLLGAMETMENITKGFVLFADLCISGIEVNREKVQANAERSTSLATMVSALFGYEIGTKIAKKAWRENITCKQAALEDKLLSEEVAEELFDVKKLTERKSLVGLFDKFGNIRKVK